MKNRILALLLAALMLSTMTACSEKDTGETTADSTAVGEENNAAETEERIPTNLPQRDFNGHTFHVLTKGQFNAHWCSKDVYAEELTGEPINDAVFNRNAVVTETYNFSIEELWGTEANCTPFAKNAIQAGEDAYDLILNGSDTTPLITAGYLMDLQSIPYMDLSKPWYDQNANATLSIAGKLMVTSGELTIMDNNATWCIQFNKNLAADLQLPDLYELVKEGKWTLDVMHSYAENASIDLNGDGIHNEFDQWGASGEATNSMFYMMGAGVTNFEKDESDIPVLVAGTEKYVDAFQKGNAINGNFDLCLNVDYGSLRSQYTDVWGDCMDKAFSEGRVLFSCAGMNRVTLFRDMEADFGVLPMPKYDEAQAEYYSPVSMWCTSLISVPLTASEPERTGIIIEALSAESLYTLTPAYYDITLQGKAVRDEESAAMLDMIFASRIFDLGNMYLLGDVFNVPGWVAINGPDKLMSTLESKKGPAQTAIDTLVNAVTGN
ncbi:MAG: hypothetical protein IKY52_11025 [Clostridia bacterium]|nr:hypothetical protein [Clostridia bacterium]